MDRTRCRRKAIRFALIIYLLCIEIIMQIYYAEKLIKIVICALWVSFIVEIQYSLDGY